jgi:hypothetical protein
MAGFFSMRVAPGVRLSASSRGLRAHVGPRMARVHVGGGGTGVSTGAGPFAYYAPLRTSAGQARPHQTASVPGVASSDKARQAQVYAQQLDAIANLHRHQFPPAAKPAAQPPVLPPFGDLLRQAEQHELQGIGAFAFRRRRAARERARAAAENQALALQDGAPAELARRQREVDDYWKRLTSNEPELLLPLFEKAFEDNQAPVAAVGVDGSEVSLVVLVPGPQGVPDKLPGTTSAGNVSLRKITKGDRASWHRDLVAGHLVLSAREAFAVGPGIATAALLAVVKTADGAFVPVLAARVRRADLGATPTDETAWELVERVGRDVHHDLKGAARELAALDLTDEPALRDLLAAHHEVAH